MKTSKQLSKLSILYFLIIDMIVLAIAFYLPISEYFNKNSLPFYKKLVDIFYFIFCIGIGYSLVWAVVYFIVHFIYTKFQKIWLIVLMSAIVILLKLIYILVSLMYL